MATVAFRLRISGRVQGVGYRVWAVGEAQRLKVSGWVRNRDDGAVEALVSGDAEAVEHFIKAARRGPSSARVSELTRAAVDSVPAATGFRCLKTE